MKYLAIADLNIVGAAAQESEQRRPSNEVKKSRKSGSQVGGKPNVEAGSGFGKTSLSGQHGEIRKGKAMRRAREKESEKENKMWWLKLPYVLVSFKCSLYPDPIPSSQLRTNYHKIL